MLHRRNESRSNGRWPGAMFALIGFVLRLGLFVGTVYLIATLVDVDRTAFGISAVVAYLTLLVLEAIAVANGRERDLSWTN